MNRKVTEADFRMPEYKDAKPEDYEFRHDDDNKPVRKDRWERGIKKIASILEFNMRDGIEIEDVVAEVELIKGLTTKSAETLKAPPRQHYIGTPPPPYKEAEDLKERVKPE